MTMATRKDILTEHLSAWMAARKNKKKRGEILRHIRFVTGMHPKAIPRAFKRIQMRDPGIPERRGRKTIYTSDVIAALKDVWEAASAPCGENLHPLIPEYVRILRRDGLWTHEEEATKKLLRMRLATVKRRAGAFVRIRGMIRGKSTTKPGAIHTLIPIRTGPWHRAPAGTVQIDTVAHCGNSIAGDYAYTVNVTDTATLWGGRRAQWNKGQEATVASMEAIAEEIPYPVVEWHPDSGSEFVNWHCKGWCETRGELLTRSRPNHKNDNCFVEERNGHVVRKWVGYARLDMPEMVSALNGLYDVLTPYLNHFIASRRVVSKERVGARWKVTREQTAMTPYDRVLIREDISDIVKACLRDAHEQMNPLCMKQEIDRRLRKVSVVYKHYGKPNEQSGFR